MAEGRLGRLLKEYPYLAGNHFLSSLVAEYKETPDDDILERVEQEMEVETQTIAAAFRRFDKDSSDSIEQKELQSMNEYLGFPSSDDDISELISNVDTDGDGTISFNEFASYVGYMGGSMKLYETRRARILAKGGRTFDGDIDPKELRLTLKEAGIEDDAEAYWRLVVAPSEFREAAKLVDCQARALAHIRHLAKGNHEKALPKVQMRVQKLGYADTDLWMSLAWIRELAPIIIHLKLDRMMEFIENDTHYRNQFETGGSGGLLNTEVRKKWEHGLFGGRYDDADGFNRCKYGVLNVMNDHRGVIRCSQYGDSYLITRDTRLRCTFSPEDSANLKSERLAVLDYYAHVLNEYTDDELKETLKVAQSSDAAILGDSDKVDKKGLKYKEAQYHGEIRWDTHIERVVAATRHRADPEMARRIAAVSEKHGWLFSWMDEEQDRMKREEQHKLGGAAWKERLAGLQETGGDEEVEEGFCKVGCGRPVAPGVTSSGRPFTTCCRGCVMGFGHDLRCGTIDPSKVGPGLCKHGCGRNIAAGSDSKGRPYSTCCRACANGMAVHDPACGIDPEEIDDGECKMNCGRKVAPGKTRSGRTFDTCCRNCARGRGHNSNCIA